MQRVPDAPSTAPSQARGLAGRSNAARTQATRAALVGAARALFAEKGYAETSTPEIVAAAGITRGALYHHFADKRDLLLAVVAAEAAAVAAAIEAAAPTDLDPRAALVAGATAYLDAMTIPGRTRLLLVEGPAVLGRAETDALDAANAGRTLEEGLAAAMAARGPAGAAPADAAAPSAQVLAALLSAAFDRAALAIDAGADPAAYRAAMTALIRAVA